MKRGRLKKILKWIIGIGLAWFLTHTVVIIIDGLWDTSPSHTAPVAIIYGNKVNEDGTLSPRLQARCDRGLELLDQGVVEFAFVSGALGKEGHEEAEKMADYLAENGIERSRIIVDNEGWDTGMTNENAALTMQKRGWNQAYIVSNYYHLTRARNDLKKQEGIEKVYTAHAKTPPEWRDFWSVFREFLGFYVYQVKS